MEILGQAPSPPASDQKGSIRPYTVMPGTLRSFFQAFLPPGLAPGLPRTPFDSRHSGVGILSTPRWLEPFRWPILSSAGQQDPGARVALSPDEPLWLRYWGAYCTQTLLGTRNGETSHPRPVRKNKTAEFIKRPHKASHLHTPPLHHLLKPTSKIFDTFQAVCILNSNTDSRIQQRGCVNSSARAHASDVQKCVQCSCAVHA